MASRGSAYQRKVSRVSRIFDFKRAAVIALSRGVLLRREVNDLGFGGFWRLAVALVPAGCWQVADSRSTWL